MPSKKKKAAPKVSRPIGTTSTPKKVVPEPEIEAEIPTATDTPVEEAAKSNEPVVQEYDPAAIEEQELQVLAEKVKPAAHREITRLIKIYDFEKRLSKTLPQFTWTTLDRIRKTGGTVDQLENAVLDKVLQTEDAPAPRVVKSEPEEKQVTKAASLYGVLERFGFVEERILECMRKIRNLELDEAVDWLVLHCPAEELSFEARTPALLQTADSPPAPTPVPSSPIVKPIKPKKKPKLSSTSTPEDFPPLPSLEDPTQAYVSTQLELYTLRRKKRTSAEEDRRLQLEELAEQAKNEYLFDRKLADAYVRDGKAELEENLNREKEAQKEKEKAVEPVQDDVQELEEKLEKLKADDKPEVDGKTEDSDDEPMFGDLLDSMPETEVGETGETIKVRDMKIPKHLSGKSVKTVLEEHVRRKDRFAKPSFKVISKSRAVRAEVTIIWDGGAEDRYTMKDEACYDQVQAYNYVATMALFALDASSVVARQLPGPFRDLWLELEGAKKLDVEATYREHVKMLRGLVEERAVLAQDTSIDINTNGLPEKRPTAATNGHSRLATNAPVDSRIQEEFFNRQARPLYQEMLEYRCTLPIAAYRGRIMQAIDNSQILILCGETGCGKSTQVPSFILEQELRLGKPCKVFCTEPRRISAISLAQRVSRELGDNPGTVGTNQSLVGYNIRLEARVSAATRLVYATTGIVLRMLEGDQNFSEITHLIIDEIHERSIDSDFLLIILKDLLLVRKDLKVVLMSATVDAEKLSRYMNDAPIITVPGRTFPVEACFLEDVIEMTGYNLPPNADSQYIAYKRKDAIDDEEAESNVNKNPAATLEASYSQRTRKTLQILEQNVVNFDLIIMLLEEICSPRSRLNGQYEGAILIFLPSLDTIRRLSEMLNNHQIFGSQSFEIHQLHSMVSSENQARVFHIPPKHIRKIVISTNIAETGITIPDCVVVIDSGKHREMRYDERRQISRLVETFIARSNGMQRRGRAGRVQEGVCFHLFTKFKFENQMLPAPLPEMLRLSLQDLALRIKILTCFNDPIEVVLLRAFDPPTQVNIQKAIHALQEAKALTMSEDITPLGRHLVKLPVDVHLGKLLLLGCLFRCIEPVLTVAATLSSKSPFITPFGREQEADTVKRSFKVENSDFLTFHRVLVGWREAIVAGNHMSYTRKNFMSHQNLIQIEELRQQFFDLLCEAGFVKGSRDERFIPVKARIRLLRTPAEANTNSEDPKLLMSIVAASMYPKLLMVDSIGQFRTLLNNAPTFIHPTSVNFTPGRKSDLDGAQFVTYFNIMHSKKLYVWECGSVEEKAILLLCGDADVKLPAQSISIDRKIRYAATPKAAMAMKVLRGHFQSLFQLRMKHPQQALQGADAEWWQFIENSLKSEEAEEEKQRREEEKPRMKVR